MNIDNIYKPGDFKSQIPDHVRLVQKNGQYRIVRLRFCWFGFLLPPLWALSEGLWRPFALSLLFILAEKINATALLSCEQNESCAAVPFTALLLSAGLFIYLFIMVYFGFNGKTILIADLLKHGYVVEGSPRTVELDE